MVFATGSDLFKSQQSTVIDSLLANRTAPCILVIDDVDILCPRSDAVSTGAEERAVLSRMVGFLDEIASDRSSRIFVLAVTSQLASIDPSVLRSAIDIQ